MPNQGAEQATGGDDRTEDDLRAENLALRIENAELRRQILDASILAASAARDALDAAIATLRAAYEARYGARGDAAPPPSAPPAKAAALNPYEGGETAPEAFTETDEAPPEQTPKTDV